MEEYNYLIFLLNNRLNENYSIRDLKREIKERLRELGKGCGDEIEMSFDSEHPERGGGVLYCGDGITCKECTSSISKKDREDAIE